MKGGKTIGKLLLRILSVLFSAVLLITAAASLILARPAPEEKDSAPATVRPDPAPALEIRGEWDLARLVSAFPAPVMSFMSGSGMTFVSAVSADTAFSGGFGRTATLYWQTEDGVPLILQSICPPDAVDLLEKGYHFSAYAGPFLFGAASVRMEKQDTVRIHTSTDQALYVLIVPETLSGRISSICRSLQLFTGHSEE